MVYMRDTKRVQHRTVRLGKAPEDGFPYSWVQVSRKSKGSAPTRNLKHCPTHKELLNYARRNNGLTILLLPRLLLWLLNSIGQCLAKALFLLLDHSFLHKPVV